MYDAQYALRCSFAKFAFLKEDEVFDHLEFLSGARQEPLLTGLLKRRTSSTLGQAAMPPCSRGLSITPGNQLILRSTVLCYSQKYGLVLTVEWAA
jgi:hypothetical protein